MIANTITEKQHKRNNEADYFTLTAHAEKVWLIFYLFKKNEQSNKLRII